MKLVKHPLISIIFFFIPGIVTGYYLSSPLYIISIVAVITLIGIFAIWLINKKSVKPTFWFLGATAILSFVLGMFTQSIHHPPNHKLHYTHLTDTIDAPVITGTIAGRLKPNKYYQRYYFETESVENKPARGKILLSVSKKKHKELLANGQRLIIVQQPKPFTRPANPYQFDYADYMHKQGVYHQLTLKNYIPAGVEKNYAYYTDKLRERLIHSFDIHHYSQIETNIIKALLFGQRQDMHKVITEQYADAGVIHVLAISGLHFGILFYLLNVLLKPLRRLYKNGAMLRFFIMISFLWGFAVLTGLSASVTRSVVMFSFILLGQLLNRKGHIYNSIATSMLVLLLFKPAFIFDVGFQMSYAAVIAIVCLQPLYNKIKKPKNKILRYIVNLLAVSTAAQIGVLPLSLYYFNQFPLLFLLANIIVIPLITVILSLSVIVLLVNLSMPTVALLAGKVLKFLILIMNKYIFLIASFEKAVLKNITISLALMFCFYLVIIGASRWVNKKSFHRTLAFLSCIILLQAVYMFNTWQDNIIGEMAILHDRKSSILITTRNKLITVYAPDSLAAEKFTEAALNENPAIKFKYKPLKNIWWWNGKKVLAIDKLAVYDSLMHPDVVLLTQSAKVNLEMVLDELKPKQVIADGTNSLWYVKQWKATCAKQKIPFHATAEKGYYMFK